MHGIYNYVPETNPVYRVYTLHFCICAGLQLVFVLFCQHGKSPELNQTRL